MDLPVIPEEDIYNTVIQSLENTFSDLVALCNASRGKNWLIPFASVLESNYEMDHQALPLVKVSLKEVKKKSSDPFVELGEYKLLLECRFDRDTPIFMPFRYAYLLKELFKTDEALISVIDRFLLEECQVHPLYSKEAPGYPESHFTFRLFRDQIK